MIPWAIFQDRRKTAALTTPCLVRVQQSTQLGLLHQNSHTPATSLSGEVHDRVDPYNSLLKKNPIPIYG